MIECRITSPNPLTHLLQIELKFDVENEKSMELILPAWRPGRYELAPFVENIHGFTVIGDDENALKWEKVRPNIWSIPSDNTRKLVVRYQYYANKMDAGNSVLDDRQLYINFINCILYSRKHQTAEIRLNIAIPEDFHAVCSLTQIDHNHYQARDYQQLVDSPVLASPDLKLLNYSVNDHEFTIAMLGDCPIEETELVNDFKKFSECQVSAMDGFPTDQYYFIVHSLDYMHYHGVEHQNSTVLVLGPNDDSVQSAYYSKLMGVASHELFHTWNVTRIRPKEMSPYAFDQETMTKTGFVTEGFTTYFGDLFLKQSGVFDLEAYFEEINTLLKRHFENYGRNESTLIQSSQNLWVDGYKNLFPSKKVSIYVKGALCALILDLKIRKNTGNQSGLIDVIKVLFEKHTYDQGGYTSEEVYSILAEIGGEGIPELLKRLYETTEDLRPLLEDSLSYVGCTLVPQTHTDKLTGQLGLKIENSIVTAIAPGSHTEQYLSVGDQLLTINGEEFSTFRQPLAQMNQITLKRGPRTLTIEVPVVDRTYYSSFKIVKDVKPTPAQLGNLSVWLGNN